MLSFVVFIIVLNSIFAAENVMFAAVIFRHGDRTPVDPYPTDPWRNESFWPVKFGELTNIGKKQHYALGQWFRARYSHLLSNKFDPSELYVRSTDVDRTLMSAEANLAGMYPPIGKDIWDTNLMWQPIPVHTVPEHEDEILAMKKPCLTYNKEKKKFINSKPYQERLKKYQNLMNYLTAYTGRKIKDYSDIEYIYNTLFIETLYNMTLPNWTHSVFPDKMKEPSCYNFRTSTATPVLARLKVGPLLKEIVTNMVNSTHSDRTPHKVKLSMYSAHDDTIGSVLNAMGMFDGNCPAYTATIIMELIRDNSTDTKYIRIYYRNTTDIVEPNVLNIPYCGVKCPLERFIKLYENLLTVNWDYECKKQFLPVLGLAFMVGLGLFSFIYIALLNFAKMSKKYRDSVSYSEIYPESV